MSEAELRKKLILVQERIGCAAERSGRDPRDVRLMAVTKGFPREIVEEAMAAGLSLFGENRVQEAEQKYIDLEARCELHLIGHLQRNKARAASGLFRCIQSIDSVDTAAALETRCAHRGKPMDILLELNTSGEQSKSGFRSRDELLACLESVAAMQHLRPRGLMTVGPLTDDEGRIRSAFASLRALFQEIGTGSFPGFDILSMGMSGDFEAAIEEGSTLVRIGTALFGRRAAA